MKNNYIFLSLGRSMLTLWETSGVTSLGKFEKVGSVHYILDTAVPLPLFQFYSIFQGLADWV